MDRSLLHSTQPHTTPHNARIGGDPTLAHGGRRSLDFILADFCFM